MPKFRYAFALLFTLLCASNASQAQAFNYNEAPMPSADFVDSIGIVAHFDKTDGVYSDVAPVGRGTQLVALLRSLGVKHYRSKLSTSTAFHDRVVAVGQNGGPVADLLIDFRQSTGAPAPAAPVFGCPLVANVAPVKTVLLDANSTPTADNQIISAYDAVNQLTNALKTVRYARFLEGPNEYDNNHGEVLPAVWEDDLADFLRVMYSRKGRLNDPYEFIAPSMGHYDREQLSGALTFANLCQGTATPKVCFQYSSSHAYPIGNIPSFHVDQGIRTGQTIAGTMTPTFQTETGYHNAESTTTPGVYNQWPVPESISARYGPRLVAEYLNTRNSTAPGIKLFNFYELADENVCTTDQADNWGFIGWQKDATGAEVLRAKPIYYSMQKTINALDDSGPVNVSPISYSLDTSNTPDVHHLLLRRSAGAFELLLWREVQLFEPTSQTLITVMPVNTNVLFTTKTFSAISVFDPARNITTHPAANADRSVDISVGGNLLIVTLQP